MTNYSHFRGSLFKRLSPTLVEIFAERVCTHCGKPLSSGNLIVTEPFNAPLNLSGLCERQAIPPPVALHMRIDAGLTGGPVDLCKECTHAWRTGVPPQES